MSLGTKERDSHHRDLIVASAMGDSTHIPLPPASAPAPGATTKGAICQITRRGRACQRPSAPAPAQGRDGAGAGGWGWESRRRGAPPQAGGERQQGVRSEGEERAPPRRAPAPPAASRPPLPGPEDVLCRGKETRAGHSARSVPSICPAPRPRLHFLLPRHPPPAMREGPEASLLASGLQPAKRFLAPRGRPKPSVHPWPNPLSFQRRRGTECRGPTAQHSVQLGL